MAVDSRLGRGVAARSEMEIRKFWKWYSDTDEK